MKQLLVILFMGSCVLQNFSQVLVFAGYGLNKSYISTSLCANKDKPQARCEGKCFLVKKLKEEKKEEAPASGSKKEIQLQLFVNETLSNILSFQINIIPSYPLFNQLLTFRFAHSVFHPPTTDDAFTLLIS